MKKKKTFIGLIIIAGFLVFCGVSFKNSLSPYITFSQAKVTKSSVQVKGTLLLDRGVKNEGNKLSFYVQDENGDVELVKYAGAKPEGFEEASSIVVIGKLANNEFAADKLLVKCPSKYQKSVNR